MFACVLLLKSPELELSQWLFWFNRGKPADWRASSSNSANWPDLKEFSSSEVSGAKQVVMPFPGRVPEWGM